MNNTIDVLLPTHGVQAGSQRSLTMLLINGRSGLNKG